MIILIGHLKVIILDHTGKLEITDNISETAQDRDIVKMEN